MSWAAAWTIARRDLNARFRGLRLLLVCLFLGTGAIAAIGTLTSAIDQELGTRGQELLGGDLQLEVWQRGLSDAEADALAAYGTLSTGTRLQVVARAGENTAPVELKAIDERWPLYGEALLADGRSVGAPPEAEAWLGQGAMDRLGIAVGDRFQVGTETLMAGGVIEVEPDRLGEGFQLGPTVIVREQVPAAAGLLQPGAMYQSKTRLAFDEPARDPTAVVDALKQRFPDAGFEYRTRDRASPGADRFVGRMGEFLTLVGLAALVIAGHRHRRGRRGLSRSAAAGDRDAESAGRDQRRHPENLRAADRRGGAGRQRGGDRNRVGGDPIAGRGARRVAAGR